MDKEEQEVWSVIKMMYTWDVLTFARGDTCGKS